MIDHFALLLANKKLLAILGIGLLADTIIPAISPNTVESWTSKFLLVAALLYALRLLAKREEENKKDREECVLAHQERDKKIEEIVKENTKAMNAVVAETAKQTGQMSLYGQRLLELGFKVAEEEKKNERS
jgi:hypothetical protein